jgi:OHCU decarboxylase
MMFQQIDREVLLACCGSRAWVDGLTKRLPSAGTATLQKAAEEVWWSLTESDWLEAFAAHPKIGEKQVSAKWSAAEQSGMAQASEQTAAAVARMNEEYERKFGWIFIVCATGKSGEEMRDILERRLRNSREAELALAAAEQMKITNLRLAKLVAE